MNLKLENKLAFVSGLTAGIGFALARGLAEEGGRGIINGRSGKRVKEAMAAIRAANPSALLEPLVADLARADGATDAVKRFPEVDILVNNLGVYAPQPFEKSNDADWLS